MIGIYKITSPSKRVYIGQSVNIMKRKYNYASLCCKKQYRIYRSILKHGWNNHVFEIVETCNIEELNDKERFWQDFYECTGKHGLNCMLTTSLTRSGKMSDACKAHLSKIKKGKKLGKAPRDRVDRQRESLIGRKLSESHKESMKIAWKKRGKFSDETKRKMALAKIGFMPVNMVKKVIDTKTGIIHSSIKEAAINNNISIHSLYKKLKGTLENKTSLRYYSLTEN